MSSAQATQYKVTVQFPDGINATFRNRAGVKVHRVHGYEGELTKEQIKAIEADPYLSLSKAEDALADDGAQAVTEAEAKAAEIIDNAKSDADTITKAAKEAAEKSAADAKAKGEEIVKAAQEQADKITQAAEAKAKDTAVKK